MCINFGIGGYSTVLPTQVSEQGPAVKNGQVLQAFKDKYGCEDCYRRQPYWVEAPINVMPLPQQVMKPSFIDRLKMRYLGG